LGFRVWGLGFEVQYSCGTGCEFKSLGSLLGGKVEPTRISLFANLTSFLLEGFPVSSDFPSDFVHLIGLICPDFSFGRLEDCD
jgi:hypothetical protein